MKSICVGVGLFIIMTVLKNVCGSYIVCQSSSRCGWCGFCTDPSKTSNLRFTCFNPYYSTTYIKKYKQSPVVCRFNYRLCNGHLCKNNGRCDIDKIYAGPVCRCDYPKGYMGQSCEMKWDRVDPESWYSGFAVIFDNFKGNTLLGQLCSVNFIAAVFNSGKKLQLFWKLAMVT